jgi:hypothetical protein
VTLIVSAINVFAILGFAFLMERKQAPAVRSLFWPAFAMKLLAGIGLGWVYQHYYSTGDTFNFFDQASAQARLFKTHAGAYFDFLWQDPDVEWKGAARSAFFVKMASIIAIVADGNYWITSLWFSFLSFIASFYLFKLVTRFFEGATAAAAAAFLFFPSVVFWGSGVIKESMGLAALMVLSGVYLKVMMKKLPGGGEFVLAAVSVWVAWNLKYYWISVFLPVVCTSLLVQAGSVRLKIPSRLKIVLWIILFFILCLGVSLLHPNFYPERILRVVIENNQAFASHSDSGDLIHYGLLEATWASVILHSPWALISGLFRPFLWEANTLLKLVVALENGLILVLCLSSFGRFGDLLRSPNRLITLSVIVYVCLLCVFLALSTPNLGSLTRYKVGFLPFLVFLVSYKNTLVNYGFSLPMCRWLQKWIAQGRNKNSS